MPSRANAAEETLADRRLFRLDDNQWRAFHRRAESPGRPKASAGSSPFRKRACLNDPYQLFLLMKDLRALLED
jgi:uncharacterized protein (DUF1778 family)